MKFTNINWVDSMCKYFKNVIDRRKIKTTKIRFPFRPATLIVVIIIMILVVFSYLRITDLYIADTQIRKTEIDPFMAQKFVHLDLKGAPPKIDYLKQIFPIFQKLGINGLLIEYEDMFPFYGPIKDIPAHNAYTLEEIQSINYLAKQHKLKIIPLIQTFGHLEYVLKLIEYKHLREAPYSAQSICPSNKQSHNLLNEMLKQIIKAHPYSNTIHIGCDEVYHLAECGQCRTAMKQHRWTKSDLFLNHIKRIATAVKNIQPNMTILLWDDVFRHMNEDEIESSHLGKYVTPVIWKYIRDVSSVLNADIWGMYARIFERVWIASAFKGATGSDNIITRSEHHVSNHRSWLKMYNAYKDSIKFEGIFITGWQRYDHFAVLCELLPVAIPTLGLCLSVLDAIPENLAPSHHILECQDWASSIYQFLDISPPSCYFPGSDILDGVSKLIKLKEDYNNMLDDSRVRGWMNEYNRKYKFSNPEYVEHATKVINRIKMELVHVKGMLMKSMLEVYDEYTIDEWMETHIIPFNSQIDEMWKQRDILTSCNEWPRRPLNFVTSNKSLSNENGDAK